MDLSVESAALFFNPNVFKSNRTGIKCESNKNLTQIEYGSNANRTFDSRSFCVRFTLDSSLIFAIDMFTVEPFKKSQH